MSSSPTANSLTSSVQNRSGDLSRMCTKAFELPVPSRRTVALLAYLMWIEQPVSRTSHLSDHWGIRSSLRRSLSMQLRAAAMSSGVRCSRVIESLRVN